MRKYLYEDEKGSAKTIRAKDAYNAAKNILRKERLYAGKDINLKGINGKYEAEYPMQVGMRKSLDNIFFNEI